MKWLSRLILIVLVVLVLGHWIFTVEKCNSYRRSPSAFDSEDMNVKF